MISISRIWCGKVGFGDELRYGKGAHKRPIVVWNCTRRCNLNCTHCYSRSSDTPYPGELTTQEGKDFIADAADFGVPVLLFSGGEPLIRRDIFELALFAKELGVRTVLSTNGTLVTEEVAKKVRKAGFSYVGISLDGIGDTNDGFRGRAGAFDAALKGIRNCIGEDLRTGLRFTVTKHNHKDIPAIFDLVERERIPRLCFYHLVYVGRGSGMVSDDLTHRESREFMDYTIKKVKEFTEEGLDTEILTVDNHADAAYIYLKLRGADEHRAVEALRLLRLNGGNSSGIGIGCVDFNGFVHSDQFWQNHSFGNVRQRRFSEIWMDESNPLLRALRDRRRLLKGRCARCSFLDICNGNLRVRAETIYGDMWAPDPACYLTGEEIGYKL